MKKTKKLGELSFKPRVLGVIGTIAAGKDALSNYLVKKYGFQKIVMSNFLRAEARKRGIKCTRDNLRKLQAYLRKTYGEDFLENKTIETILTKDHMRMKKVVIDGLRTPRQVKITKEKLGAKIIMVDADPFIRYMRQKKRGRTGFQKTYEQFLHEEAIEYATFDLHKTFKLADFKIDNSSTLEHLYSQVDKLIKKLKLDKK